MIKDDNDLLSEVISLPCFFSLILLLNPIQAIMDTAATCDGRILEARTG